MRFELVQPETHAFPDVGGDAPQHVIDKHLPVDYDVYLGITWARTGTPTSRAISDAVAPASLPASSRFSAAFNKRSRPPRKSVSGVCSV